MIKHKRLLGMSGEVPEESYEIPLGVANVLREGSDVTVIGWGRMVNEALTAAEQLAADGIDVEVIDPRTIAPLDLETILTSVRKTMRLAIAHEAHRTGGFGAELAALCQEHAFEHLDAPIERVAALDVPIPTGPEWSAVYPTADSIIAAVERLCGIGAAA